MRNKELDRIRAREWYRNHKETIKIKRRKRTQEIKFEVLSHYSNNQRPTCKCCGENHLEFLALDHINGDGGLHRKYDRQAKKLASWVKRNGYPAGFQVLCMNCNFAKGRFGYCPHNKQAVANGVQ